jgi:hypothetical protein
MSRQYEQASAYASFLNIELLQGVLSTAELPGAELPILNLSLSRTKATSTSRISLGVLEQVLTAVHANYLNLEGPAGIVLGAKSDPFYPIQGRLDAALKTIELLAQMQPDGLIIQTRSPLILLAAPILLAIRDRLRVVIALEAPTDKDHHLFTPEYPRPSERLETALALADLGIHTVLQFAPISSSPEAQDLVQSYRTYCSGLRLIKLSDCLNGAVSGYLPPQISAEQQNIMRHLPDSQRAYRTLQRLIKEQGDRDERHRFAA